MSMTRVIEFICTFIIAGFLIWVYLAPVLGH